MSAVFLSFLFCLLMVHVRTQNLIHPRLINGKDAISNHFPFIVSIEIGYLPFAAYFHACIGIMLNEYWILSTAICVKRTLRIEKSRVRLGMQFLNEDSHSVQVIEIADKIVHANFSGLSNFWANDIGLFYLKTAISRPVRAQLSKPEDTLTGEVSMIGWAQTVNDIFGLVAAPLQYADYRILEKERCRSIFSEVRDTFQLQDSQMCTQSITGQLHVYTEDSGGPMVQYVNDEPKIVGLLSWTVHPHVDILTPTISTRVSSFIEWINSKIAENPTYDPITNLLIPLFVS